MIGRLLHRALVAAGIALVPCSARAAEPSKLECIAADDAAQALRRSGKLHEAREKLALCVSAGCPGLVRDDCAQRLAEIDTAMPTVVFEPTDSAGNALVAVVVTMDGQRLTGPLAGPVQMDPGEHRFIFEADGRSTEETVVVREGDRRHERVVLGEPARPAAPTPSQVDVSPEHIIAVAMGGAGAVSLVVGSVLGFVAKSNYDHALRTECGGDANGGCSSQGIADGKSAHGVAAASTVAFVAGGALLVTGAVLYFATPAPGVRVGAILGGDERAGLQVSGRW